MAGGANDLRDSLLPAVDAIRGIPGLLGLRLYTVTITARQWTGARVGTGTSSDTTTGLKIDLGAYPVKFRILTNKEVVSSGGLYQDQDAEVGPITPPYTGSTQDNDAIAVFDPPPGSNPVEVFFNVIGPGYASPGAWFEKVSHRVDQSFRYTFVLRKTAWRP